MDNIFKKIINNEISSYKIYEDENTIAILDIFPKSNGHVLVIPKKESVNLFDINNDDLKNLIIVTKTLALHIVKKLKVSAFSLHINNGKNSNQKVFYTHIHIIPENSNNNLSFDDMKDLLYTSYLDLK